MQVSHRRTALGILALSLVAGASLWAQANSTASPKASAVLARMKQGPKQPSASSPASPEDALHQAWDRLLKKHVNQGVVSYQGFQKEEAELDAYLSILAKTDPSTLSREGQLAFWINAYNAYTIKLILRRYPKIKSIRDYWGPWKKKDWVIHGTKMSLDDIEHGTIRAEFQDPRIHAAVNCASISCPDLLAEAFVPSKLDAQLDGVMQSFLKDSSKGLSFGVEKGYFYGSSPVLRLSKIFDWYGKDFGSSEAEVVQALKAYMPPEAVQYVETHGSKLDVKYLSYDWNLNGK